MPWRKSLRSEFLRVRAENQKALRQDLEKSGVTLKSLQALKAERELFLALAKAGLLNPKSESPTLEKLRELKRNRDQEVESQLEFQSLDVGPEFQENLFNSQENSGD